MDEYSPDRFFLKGVKYLGWRTAFRKRIRTGSKRIQNTFYPLYKAYILTVVTLFRVLVPARYTDANPFKKVYVDPGEIVYETDGPCRHRGWVVDGEWDIDCRRIDNSELYACFERRF